MQLDYCNFKSIISLIHLAELYSKAFLVSLRILKLIGALLVVTKLGRNCCKLPLITTENDEEEARQAAAAVL